MNNSHNSRRKKTQFNNKNRSSKEKLRTNRPSSTTESDEIRLNKFISNSGVCTRKEADLYIETGSVRVNGKVVTEMGYKVKLTDEVRFDGQLIKPTKKVYILLNKPKGFTTEFNTTNIKKSIYSLTNTASKDFLKPVGKIERNASGLLVLTNDESLLSELNSSRRISKIYHVKLNKPLAKVDYDKISKGIRIRESIIKVDNISFIETEDRKEVGIELKSQKNKIVTKIFENLGYEINYLDRVTFGGLTKKDLPRGRWRSLTKQELINFKMIS